MKKYSQNKIHENIFLLEQTSENTTVNKYSQNKFQEHICLLEQTSENTNVKKYFSENNSRKHLLS